MMTYMKMLLSFCKPKEQYFLIALLGLMLVAAVIELAGVGSLFPYIEILSKPSIITQNHILNNTYNLLNFKSQNHFLIFIGLAIFAIIMLKGVITVLNNYLQGRFSASINKRLSTECLQSYLQIPYSQIINKHSAVLSKHLLYDVQNVAAVITAVLALITNALVGFALIGLMIWTDPMLVLFSIGSLGTFLWLSITLTKRRMKALSHANERDNRMVYKLAAEILSGIKDIKTLGVEKHFVEQYAAPRKRLSHQTVEFGVIATLPAVVMNVMGFGVLLIILLYLLFVHGSMMSVLPIIGIIAICIQRLLPCATTISSSIGVVRQYKPVITIVRDAIDDLEKLTSARKTTGINQEKLIFNKQLLLKNISYQYPNADKTALTDITLSINRYSSLGIIGMSGAGKSTLVDVLLGLLPVQQGEIWCDEINITHCDQGVFSHLVGYVPQQTFLIDASIKNNIAFGIDEDQIDMKALSNAITVAQLEKLIADLPDGLETVIGERGVKLSGGQRQRIGIARALYKDPEILILDEATNSLDSITESEFNDSLKKLMQKKTLIVIAHRLSSIRFCEKIIMIDSGRIIEAGSYAELSSQSKRFNELYKENASSW